MCLQYIFVFIIELEFFAKTNTLYSENSIEKNHYKVKKIRVNIFYSENRRKCSFFFFSLQEAVPIFPVLLPKLPYLCDS